MKSQQVAAYVDSENNVPLINLSSVVHKNLNHRSNQESKLDAVAQIFSSRKELTQLDKLCGRKLKLDVSTLN